MFPLNKDVWGGAELNQYEVPFWERLKNRPLNIGGLIKEQFIKGASDVITSFDIPDMGYVVTSKGAKAETEKITFWKTLLKPVWITSGNIVIDDDTLLTIQDGVSNSQLLNAMSDRCARRYDKLCMDSLTSDIQMLSGKVIPFNDLCRIPFDTTQGGNPEITETNDFGGYLTPQKLNLATKIMDENGIPETAMKVCLLTPYQALMFRNNPEIKSTDYNIIPALRFDDLGRNGYGSISGFIKTNLVPTGQNNKGANENGGTAKENDFNNIERVYVVAFDYLRAGFRSAWSPTITGKQIDKSIPYVTMTMHGCYGVTRMQDPAVVVIECLSKTPSLVPLVVN